LEEKPFGLTPSHTATFKMNSMSLYSTGLCLILVLFFSIYF
jgi:hypothetical protein